MQRREKQLTALVLVLVTGLGLFLGGNWLFTAYSSRAGQLKSVESDIDVKTLTLRKAARANKQLTAWKERSLPADENLARTLYQNWLTGLVERVGFAQATVTGGRAEGKAGSFRRLGVEVSGQGTMEQVVRFLHEFYRANHMQQIRALSLTPISGSQQMEVRLSLDAMIVPDAEPNKPLNAEASDRLVAEKLDDYRKVILDRNLFAPYSPPPPPPPPVVQGPPPPLPPAFDSAKFAFFTASLQVGAERLVWLNVRTTGQVLKLRVGEEFKVGDLTATILRIGVQEVEIESEGQRVIVALGKSLRDGAKVPAQANSG